MSTVDVDVLEPVAVTVSSTGVGLSLAVADTYIVRVVVKDAATVELGTIEAV